MGDEDAPIEERRLVGKDRGPMGIDRLRLLAGESPIERLATVSDVRDRSNALRRDGHGRDHRSSTPFADEHGGAADRDAGQPPRLDVEGDADEARPTHLHALIERAVVIAVSQSIRLEDRADESRGGSPRGGVFRDAETRRHHPRAIGVRPTRAVGRVEIEGLARALPAPTQSNAGESLHRGERNEGEGDTGGEPGRLVTAEADRLRLQAGQGGDLGR